MSRVIAALMRHGVYHQSGGVPSAHLPSPLKAHRPTERRVNGGVPEYEGRLPRDTEVWPKEMIELEEGPYLSNLRGVRIFEVAGGIDFEAAADFGMALLDPSDPGYS